MNDLQPYYPDFEPNVDMDDDELYHIKQAVEKLSYLDKKVFLQYTELGTYTELAKLYGVTPPTAKKYIEKIRRKIYNNL